MSKSSRETMKRHCESALNGTDKSMNQLNQMIASYKQAGDDYKDYWTYLEIIVQQVQIAQDNLLIFRQNFL
jgi:hypothetical protein